MRAASDQQRPSSVAKIYISLPQATETWRSFVTPAQSDLAWQGLMHKAKSFSGFAFKRRAGGAEWDPGEALGAFGSLEAQKKTEGALDKELLALAFVPALPSCIFNKFL